MSLRDMLNKRSGRLAEAAPLVVAIGAKGPQLGRYQAISFERMAGKIKDING
jgi:hypothetical protein